VKHEKNIETHTNNPKLQNMTTHKNQKTPPTASFFSIFARRRCPVAFLVFVLFVFIAHSLGADAFGQSKRKENSHTALPPSYQEKYGVRTLQNRTTKGKSAGSEMIYLSKEGNIRLPRKKSFILVTGKEEFDSPFFEEAMRDAVRELKQNGYKWVSLLSDAELCVELRFGSRAYMITRTVYDTGYVNIPSSSDSFSGTIPGTGSFFSGSVETGGTVATVSIPRQEQVESAIYGASIYCYPMNRTSPGICWESMAKIDCGTEVGISYENGMLAAIETASEWIGRDTHGISKRGYGRVKRVRMGDHLGNPGIIRVILPDNTAIDTLNRQKLPPPITEVVAGELSKQAELALQNGDKPASDSLLARAANIKKGNLYSIYTEEMECDARAKELKRAGKTDMANYYQKTAQSLRAFRGNQRVTVPKEEMERVINAVEAQYRDAYSSQKEKLKDPEKRVWENFFSNLKRRDVMVLRKIAGQYEARVQEFEKQGRFSEAKNERIIAFVLRSR
jgi:hypothetical protein